MLTEVLFCLLAGAVVALLAKLGTGHRSQGAFVFAALVGAFGGMVGLFLTRMVGIPREQEGMVVTAAALGGLATTLVYALLSRLALRRSARRRRHAARSSIAF